MQEYIPPQLLQPPRTVVALVNLKENHHLFIPPLVGEEDSLTQCSPCYDTSPEIKFRVISADLGQPFPKKKERKNSAVEAYVPPGILQSYWLTKHTCQLPAVMAVLFQWDDEGDWRQRETHIRNQLDAIKYNHRTRSIKYLVVLVQKKASQLDLTISEERLRSIKQHSDLDSKSIIVVSLDSLAGSMPQLRAQLGELATAFYTEEAVRIKAQMKRLNPATQRSLFVRYHFKVAFINEFKHDLPAAIMHYKHAYDALASMKHPAQRIHEFKSMAEILSFKVLQLQLASGEVNTQHFFRLIRDYRQYSGDPRRVFEHFEWLARQYVIMAQLMAQLGPEAVPPSVEDASFFYEGAFANAMERKQWAHRLCGTAAPAEAVPMEWQQPVWVGQRPAIVISDPEHLSADVAELEVAEAVRAESQVDHSALLMCVLGEALDFVSRRNLRRMMMSLSIKMGTELFSAGQYQKAKELLQPVAAAYRKECWWALLTPVINTSSLCSWHLSLARDYIWDTLELLPACMNDSAEQKGKMQQVVFELMADPAKYAKVFGDVKALMPICYSVDSSFQLISTQVQWADPTVRAQSSSTLTIALTSSAEHPLPIAAIDLVLSDPALNCAVTVPEGSELQPGAEQLFTVEFSLQHVNELQVEQLQLHLGTHSQQLRLDFSVAPAQLTAWQAATALSKLENATLAADLVRVPLSNVLLERPAVKVLSPPATLTMSLEHASPLLLCECFRVQLTLEAGSDHVSDATITLPELGTVEGLELLDEAGQSLEELTVAEILPEGSHTVVFMLRASRGAQAALSVQCVYTTQQGFTQTVLLPVELRFQQALQASFHFLDASTAQQVSTVSLSEGAAPTALLTPGVPVVMLVQLSCSSEHAVELLSVQPELSFGTITELTGASGEPTVMLPSDQFSASWLLNPAAEISSDQPQSSLQLSFQRHTSPSEQTQLTVPVPAMLSPKLPVEATISEVPERIVCGEPAALTVRLVNNSELPLKFSIQLLPSEDFIVAGAAQVHTPQMQPGAVHQEEYSVVPVKCGEVTLPGVEVQPSPESAALFQQAVGGPSSLHEHLNGVLSTKRIAFAHPSGVDVH